jgi:uncharacterized DUF497 family protein
MEFEYDPAKSAANKDKHGIDFVEARALWRDRRAIRAPARTGSESRFLVVGKIGERHWVAVCTYRSENVRIISVRRARSEEIRRYERS